MRDRRATESFEWFVRRAWRIVEGARPLIWSRHMSVICTKLEGVLRRLDAPEEPGMITLVINVPPRHSKSTLVSVMLQAFDWMRNPGRVYLTVSRGDRLARRHSRQVRKVVSNSWYRRMLAWRDDLVHYTLAHDANKKDDFENSATGRRFCATLKSGITGEGADIIILDDIHDVKDAIGSAHQVTRRMDEAWEIWDEALSSRFNDTNRCALIVIAQRIHQLDTPGRLLAEGAESLVLPTEYDSTHPYVSADDWRTEPGELLCPRRFSDEFLDKKRKNTTAYAAQHQQRPTPKEGNKFKAIWFRQRYDTDPLRMQMDRIEIHVDAAAKKGENNSYTSMQVWGRRGTSEFYLLDEVWGQFELPELEREFRLLCKRWPRAAGKYVEDKSHGTALIQVTRDIPSVIGINPKGSKEERAQYSITACEAGNVWLPTDAAAAMVRPERPSWVRDWEQEHLGFLAGAPKDDRVDTTSQVMERWVTGAVAPEVNAEFGWVGAMGSQ